MSFSFKIYGKKPSGERLKRIQSSLNYKNGFFQNQSTTLNLAEDASFLRVALSFMNKPGYVKPSRVLPSVKSDLKHLPARHPTIVWFGHSSYLVQIEGRTILVDPVFSGSASPFSFMVPAFPGSDMYSTEDLPEIDILLLTHDHYDHLDYKTVLKLRSKVKKICCSLGVGAHLEYWGFDPVRITELDWWDQVQDQDLMIMAAPARHFSGRSIKRNQSLWSSFILKTPNYNFYLGGDSGYDAHFRHIGETFGPFDLVILECGQYNTAWPQIHMMPEETVQAALDLKAAVLLPVHWGKFSLALHPWDEPIRRLLKKAEGFKLEVTTPRIGEMLQLGAPLPVSHWWEG